ncbi:MAG: hypothetical protein K0S74_1491 [Chlamydiales bacterium]|nr:hypothetical protein [Chlamydiales bacterium]
MQSPSRKISDLESHSTPSQFNSVKVLTTDQKTQKIAKKAFENIQTPLEGHIYVDKSHGFACIQLAKSPVEKQNLQLQLLEDAKHLAFLKGKGINPECLSVPIAPAGQEDIGPHVTLVHFTEARDGLINWELLEQYQGVTAKIDCFKEDHIIFTDQTRTARHMLLVEVESQDFYNMREKLGLTSSPIDQRTNQECPPHITVAVIR